jgi:hypothetical protein
MYCCLLQVEAGEAEQDVVEEVARLPEAGEVAEEPWEAYR